jgi:chorismate synthase
LTQPHLLLLLLLLPPAVINEVRVRGESCGGVVTCVVRNCPKGLGNPVFDKLEAELAKAMLSLPATKVSNVPHVLVVTF